MQNLIVSEELSSVETSVTSYMTYRNRYVSEGLNSVETSYRIGQYHRVFNGFQKDLIVWKLIWETVEKVVCKP